MGVLQLPHPLPIKTDSDNNIVQSWTARPMHIVHGVIGDRGILASVSSAMGIRHLR